VVSLYDMYDSIGPGIDPIMNVPDLHDNATSLRRFQAIKEHLFSELKDEAVILSLKNGKYYGLNAVGVSVWTAVQDLVTLAEIESAIMLEYEVDEETCRREVMSFLDKMVDEKLIETIDERGR
jgi:hypothetical protein